MVQPWMDPCFLGRALHISFGAKEMTLFYELPGGSIVTKNGAEVVRVFVKNLQTSEAVEIMNAILDALDELEKKWRAEIDQRDAEDGAELLKSIGIPFQ